MEPTRLGSGDATLAAPQTEPGAARDAAGEKNADAVHPNREAETDEVATVLLTRSEGAASGSEGAAGSGSEAAAGSGSEGAAGSGSEAAAGSGSEAAAGSGSEGAAGSGSEAAAGSGSEGTAERRASDRSESPKPEGDAPESKESSRRSSEFASVPPTIASLPSGARARFSMPIIEVELDPKVERPRASPTRGGLLPLGLTPRATAVSGSAIGLAVFGVLWGLLSLRTPYAGPLADRDRVAAGEDSLSRGTNALRAGSDPVNARLEPSTGAGQDPPARAQPGPGGSAQEADRGSRAAASEPPSSPSVPGPWRVSQLASDPEIRLIRGTVERRSFIDTLVSAGIPKPQVYRLLAAFNPIHHFDKPHRHDRFVAAITVDRRTLRAFEYEASVTEIYQARESEDGTLRAERLDLHVESKTVAAAVVVGDDLAGSFRNAGLDPSLADLLEDALEGRAQLSSIHPGARLRILTEEQTALGVFARYTGVLAVEHRAGSGDAPALRIYRYQSGGAQGYFDAKGRQPYKGGWRSPIPFARISSRFNPRRMHPVLHVIRPHNGVDFAASTGTPVYAACSGHVLFVGDGGPSGNLVTLQHANAITTGYAHLSRFASGLRSGQAVEVRQLIGYVGSTGRSTGPHLHFSARKNGTFIDPLTLKLDGERVLPKGERAGFEEERVRLDQKLDAIALPVLPEAVRARLGAEPDEPQETESLDDDKP